MVKINLKFGADGGTARFATVLVSNAAQFSSHVFLKYKQKTVPVKNTPKSIMEIVDLDIRPFEDYQVIVDGPDEDHALFVYKLRLQEFQPDIQL
ncbi:HPr family phosphocarrier protein [Terribacillus halophilus]|jgi:phosphocarrier protein HPr|uniref:HPr family phosphocarrier protein n=1 Tax=Terribacillus halophilus TaxID=361279 RepID=UPI000986E5D4|nr:HPr family phosphocarrier protein [Terribacillus halophilus]